METNVLFISGRISEREVRSLSLEFENDSYRIEKYSAAGIHGIHDIVNLFFHDFSVYSFIRDLALAKILGNIWSRIGAVATRLKAKHKIVGSVSIEILYKKSDGTIIYINFHSAADKMDTLLGVVQRHITPSFFEGVSGGRNVSITLDSEDKLIITVFP